MALRITVCVSFPPSSFRAPILPALHLPGLPPPIVQHASVYIFLLFCPLAAVPPLWPDHLSACSSLFLSSS